MLEEARKKGASVFIYLIFCLLIVVFVINFGPQGGQGGGGCSDSSNVVISVDGEEPNQSAFQVAYLNPYNPGRGQTQRKYVALETLIRRELLAQEAERRGLRVTDDLVMDAIKNGHFYVGGVKVQIPGIFNEDGLWMQTAFRNWVGGLNVSRNSYIGEQQRSMLASMMSQILQDSVVVSRDEALNEYLFENNTVTYDLVAFRPEAYRAAMKLTDADVERFLATHGAEVEARYKTDERTYKGLKPQLQLRQIFIAKLDEPKPVEETPPAPDQGSAAPAPAPKPDAAKPDTKKADEKKVGMKIDDAKAKLEAVRAAVAAGKQKFVDAARQLNTDEAMKSTGGELGWRTAESAMLGDKAVTDAVKDLKPGEMTPVITTDRGAYLVLAEDKREGDLTFDQVKREIAKELARDVWSKEAAKRAALSALDKARSGTGLNLDQLYEKAAPPANPGINIEEILNDPNLPAEQKQRILEMLMKQQQGSLTIESKDVPASWKAQADGAGGSATTPAASPPAAAQPAAGSAAQTTQPTPEPKQPAAGSAAAQPAAGADAAAPPAAPAAPVTASTDKLPEFGEVPKATVTRHGPAPRAASLPGLGASKPAIDALFDELTPGMLAKQVYEADGGYAVVQLITKEEPKVEDFEKEAERLVEELRRQRSIQFVESWLQSRCEELAKDGKIRPNPGLIAESDEKGNPIPTTYRPCSSFR